MLKTLKKIEKQCLKEVYKKIYIYIKENYDKKRTTTTLPHTPTKTELQKAKVEIYKRN